jgi:hypothetical protein
MPERTSAFGSIAKLVLVLVLFEHEMLSRCGPLAAGGRLGE